MKGFISALQFLTIIKIRKVEPDLSGSLYWFSVVGLIIGFLLCFTYRMWNLLSLPKWNSGLAIIIVFLEIIITGALHLDGLSDWADSLGAYDREKKLEIMRDSNIGVLGGIAIVFSILFRLISTYRIISLNKVNCILIVPSISRTMMVEMCVTMPYARENGKGKGFVQGAENKHRLASIFIGVVFSFLFYQIRGLILFSLGYLITLFLKWRFRRTFSGITGDLIGATNEIVTILLLFLGAMI